MESLIRLINCLKSKEVQMVKDFCKAGGTRINLHKKKLQLFELILEGKIQNDQHAYHLLYPHYSPSALCKLKKRLQCDIQNIILLSPFTHVEEEGVKEELGCYKSFLLGKLLINRGLRQEGIHMLEKTSLMADKCELPDINLACCDTLRTIEEPLNHKACQSYGEKINRSLDNFKHLLQAKSFYYAALPAKLSPDISLPGAKLEQLEEKLNACQTSKAVYWYTMTLIHYYIRERDYDSARNCACELFKRVSENLHIVTAHEQAEFHLQFARVSLYSEQACEAVRYAKLAVKLFHESRQSKLTAMEVLFFAYFRNHDWKQAEGIIDAAYKEEEIQHESSAGAWSVLKSSLLFMQKKFRESNSWLLSHESLLNEKSYTILWAKLLELLNILEMQDYDWFEFKLESFRKRLRRWDVQSTERIWMLYQLFQNLRKNDYNYKSILLHDQSNLAILQSKNHMAGWDPLSYELINISEWFLLKFRNSNTE